MTAILEDAEEITFSKWGSLNTAASPQKLPEGQSPNNQNVYMDEKPGSLVTAPGFTKLGTNPSNTPNTFLLNYFKSSDGSQTVILSDGTTIWKTTDYVNYTQIKTGLSPSFQLRGMVIRDKLWLVNGSDPVMTYDGTTLVVLNGNGGTPNVPIAKYISYHDERVWLYGIVSDLSSLRFSDLTDSTGTEITPDDADAWPVDNELQISEGDADIGTGLFVYRGYLYASKSYSIWRIVGYDEYTYTRVKTRSSTGTRFQESVQELDNLVNFIGVDGMYVFDGEDSQRISDIVDPANPDAGVFSFRNLQQPLLNNQFWNISETADISTGTVPANISSVDDKITLAPADNTKANFDAGTLLTNIDTSTVDGSIQLSLVNSGGDGPIVSLSATPSLSSFPRIIGAASYINDGNLSSPVGYQGPGSTVAWGLSFSTPQYIGGVKIRKLTKTHVGLYDAYVTINGTTGVEFPDIIAAGALGNNVSNVDYTLNFPAMWVTSLNFSAVLTTNYSDGILTLTEFEAYKAGYQTSGKFISKTLDYTVAPASFGSLAATITTNGEAYQFFTQSSSDGSSWDAEVNVANGGTIGSTVKRYLRWGSYLYSSTGVSTPIVDKVFVGGTYLSPIHNTGGSIFQWGAYSLLQNKAGQTIKSYFRAAVTAGGVPAASWTEIVPGAVPNTAVTNVYIQIRLELSTTNSVQIPYVDGFTVNWVIGTGFGMNTLQNVSSFVWLNRYWLSAATVGATSNDIVLVRGKGTYGSPWHKRDFSILSFARFQDYMIAGSSIDGSIYRMEYGYSKDGAAMDSFFETADFSKSGFLLKLMEIIVNLDRTGPYSLNVGVSTDGGITWTEKTVDLTLATGQNVGFTKKLVGWNVFADKFRVRVRINAADQPFSVDDLTCYYRLSPMRGSLN